jgi:excisionase family DNA binding protein
MVLYVRQLSVAEVAQRLGVSVPRVHQRITDGSLPAVRIGSQWVIEEALLPVVSDLRTPGRRLSRRSAWALVAASRLDRKAMPGLASTERTRAGARLQRLVTAASSQGTSGEVDVKPLASLLRSWMRNRAERRLFRASPRDLPDLRDDGRVRLSGLNHALSRIASGDLVEGYLTLANLSTIVDDYVLTPLTAGSAANVVLHVTSEPVPGALLDAALLLAADLAEYGTPREEARAVELLRSISPNPTVGPQ